MYSCHLPGSLSGTLPSTFSRLRNLNQVYLDNNHFVGPIPSSWGGANQPVLQVFALQNNSLTGSIPPSLVNGSNMCILLLNDNRLRGCLPPLSPALFRAILQCSVGCRYCGFV